MVSQTLTNFTWGFQNMLSPILMVPGPQNSQKLKFLRGPRNQFLIIFLYIIYFGI